MRMKGAKMILSIQNLKFVLSLSNVSKIPEGS